MRGYFRLLDNDSIPGRWHLGAVRQEGVRVDFWRGIPYEGPGFPPLELARDGVALPFCLTGLASPIAHFEVADAISEIAGADLQRVPVMIEGHYGYEALNALRVVRCLDESRSEFMKWTADDPRPDLAGHYRMVTNLKIDVREVPPDTHLFRIEDWRIALIVSQRVREAMEARGCLGAVFQDVT